MNNPLSFSGQIRPLPYALWSALIFFSQHLVVLAAFKLRSVPLDVDGWFLVIPLRALVTQAKESDLVLVLGFAYLFLVAWALATLAFRRAADAHVSGWSAAAAMVPVVQIPAILILAVLPSRAAAAPPAVEPPAGDVRRGIAAALQGMIAGMAVTLASVAIGALVFGVYGYGMFLASPFVVGAVTAYLANRPHTISEGRTSKLAMAAAMLGGIALVLAALEGVVCIVMAAPLGLGAAVVGGLLGRAIAAGRKSPPRQMVPGIALLPLVFAVEYGLATVTTFDTMQTIDVNAPREAVWASIIKMDTIEPPRSLPFRLGVAYPVRGEVIGEGVGAIRHGEFSTGVALERVTEWVINSKLAFEVTNDIPALRELSPYEHVHAPHVIGYFRTSTTSFELLDRDGGGTTIVERTAHELRLEPILYWLPMARFIVAQNNARVLAHIKRQAEGRREVSAR